MAEISWEIRKVRKDLWAFFLIVLFGCWLAEQANCDHMETSINKQTNKQTNKQK